ncbi:MAG: hypothetical protein V3G42_00825 [Oscillospiraceae bacterium]
MSTREIAYQMIDGLNEEQLNALVVILRSMTREQRNQAYLQKIDEGFAQIENGTCQQHDLIEVDEDGKTLV